LNHPKSDTLIIHILFIHSKPHPVIFFHPFSGFSIRATKKGILKKISDDLANYHQKRIVINPKARIKKIVKSLFEILQNRILRV
jgi:hypothetical protein